MLMMLFITIIHNYFIITIGEIYVIAVFFFL